MPGWLGHERTGGGGGHEGEQKGKAQPRLRDIRTYVWGRSLHTDPPGNNRGLTGRQNGHSREGAGPSASADHTSFRRGGILAGKNEHGEQRWGIGENLARALSRPASKAHRAPGLSKTRKALPITEMASLPPTHNTLHVPPPAFFPSHRLPWEVGDRIIPINPDEETGA